MKRHRILGLMSGTSLDGVDLAGCSFYRENGHWRFSFECAETIPYSVEWKEVLLAAMNESGAGLSRLHMEYGHYLGNLSKEFINRWGSRPDYISSHGHTVFHMPDLGHTFQLGSGAAMAAASGLPVICDFRSKDVALGGQGAPLVPIGDELLFPDYDYCLNIGGIANVSFRDNNGSRLAYDICPANMVLNHLARKTGGDFDRNGEMAAKGKADPSLLRQLEAVGYYLLELPKTLGREYVEKHFFSLLDNPVFSMEDKLSTFSEHIAQRIGYSLGDNQYSRALVTGGGAKNRYLVERIREYTSCEIVIPEEIIIDFKEALIFAFLGALRTEGVPNCLSSVTGASCDSIGGTIYL